MIGPGQQEESRPFLRRRAQQLFPSELPVVILANKNRAEVARAHYATQRVAIHAAQDFDDISASRSNLGNPSGINAAFVLSRSSRYVLLFCNCCLLYGMPVSINMPAILFLI